MYRHLVLDRDGNGRKLQRLLLLTVGRMHDRSKRRLHLRDANIIKRGIIDHPRLRWQRCHLGNQSIADTANRCHYAENQYKR